jgi:hypothetical protein
MKENTESTNHLPAILKGILYSNIFALAAFAVAYFITNWNSGIGGVLTFSEFVLVPLGMGIIAMKFWIHFKKRPVALLPLTILNTLLAIALSALFMGEGVICLLIVSPLILGFMFSGVVIGKYMYQHNNTTLKSSTFLVFITLFVYDTFSEHNYTNIVSDEITINASREDVWKYVAAHPLNSSAPDYWLFKIGLPQPIQSTVTADTIGSQRQCVFSNGAIFDEVVVENETDSLFTFDIVKQPEDPEIIGHIQIKRGQFILKENPDGTTTLVGISWYTLKVYPVWYYDLWAEDITRNVHLRVMKHIKALAENDI